MVLLKLHYATQQLKAIYIYCFEPTRSLIIVINDKPKVAIFRALTRYVQSEHSLYTRVGVVVKI